MTVRAVNAEQSVKKAREKGMTANRIHRRRSMEVFCMLPILLSNGFVDVQTWNVHTLDTDSDLPMKHPSLSASTKRGRDYYIR
jgi:hypothetical protein